MRRLATLTLVLALVAVACGDDNGSTTTTAGQADAALVAGLRQKIVENQADDPGTFDMDDEQITCFATGLIDSFGGERISVAMTTSFDDFMAAATQVERREVVDTMFSCIDLGPTLAQELGGDAISAESATCLADAMLGSNAFRDALAADMGGTGGDPFEDPALLEELLPAMLSCLSAAELVELGNS